MATNLNIPPLSAPVGMSADAPSQEATAPPQPPVQAQPVLQPGQVILSQAELEQFRAAQQQLKEIEDLARQQELEDLQKKLNDQAAKDPLKALDEQRDHYNKQIAEYKAQLARYEMERLSEKKEAVLNAALAGLNFAGETQEQKATTARFFRQIVGDQFQVARNALGDVEVREKGSMAPAGEALRALLAKPEYQIFFAPRVTQGGSGGDGSRTLAAAPSEPPLSEFQRAQVEFIRARQNTPYPSMGLHRPRPRTS